jgi:diacylglycerol kinase family enzyme
MTRRLAAGAALAFGAVPDGLPVVACAVLAALVTWWAAKHTGSRRAAGLVLAAMLVAAAFVLITVNDRLVEDLAIIGALLVSVAAARTAFAIHVALPPATPPRRPMLFWNGRSGGGKATRFHLEDEAHARGFETVELRAGDDLELLVRGAIERGADGLAMAGGDGSQAVVARIAAEHDLPYACVPAGTRNHFALDLGVNRDDVVGALDAFVDGGERRVDLADVNGRVFVNNVSLGVYADAVQESGYRDAKLRTLLDTYAVDGAQEAAALHWTGPDGDEDSLAPAVLVSNNVYRLGTAIGSGTRPHIDAGLLGITVFDEPGHHRGRPWREWVAPRFEVGADHAVNAGIDGEAAVLDPPLSFASHPQVLRVRVARQHPGASPSAAIPDSASAAFRALARIARGRTP